MKLFENKEKISRKEFRDFFKKKNPILPGTGQRLFSIDEKKKMEEKLFRREQMGFISKDEYKNFIAKKSKEKYLARDWARKRIVEKKIKFLRKLGDL